MSHRTGPRKYDPLTAYLAAFAGNEVTLTLVEVEQIIGAPLPRSAVKAAFWSNTPHQVALPPWVEAGWRMRRTHLSDDPPAVTFVRHPSARDA
jgi:hypothetical protein